LDYVFLKLLKHASIPQSSSLQIRKSLATTLMQLDVSENTTRHEEMTSYVPTVTMSLCSDNFCKTSKVDILVVT